MPRERLHIVGSCRSTPLRDRAGCSNNHHNPDIVAANRNWHCLRYQQHPESGAPRHLHKRRKGVLWYSSTYIGVFAEQIAFPFPSSGTPTARLSLARSPSPSTFHLFVPFPRGLRQASAGRAHGRSHPTKTKPTSTRSLPCQCDSGGVSTTGVNINGESFPPRSPTSRFHTNHRKKYVPGTALN